MVHPLKVMLAITLALAAGLAPAWFGGVTPLAASSINLLGLVAGMLGLAVAVVGKGQGRPLPVVLLALLLPVVGWGALGLLPLDKVPGMVGFAHPLWQQAALAVNVPHAYISLTPVDGLAVLLHICTMGALALAAYTLAVQPREHGTWPEIMLAVLGGIGLLVCLYGLVAYALGSNHVLWYEKQAYVGNLTATFINRNSFATFGGLASLVCLAVFTQRIGEVPGPGRATLRQRLRMVSGLLVKPRWPWLVGAMICFAAVMLSSSRAGMLFTILGLLVFCVTLFVAVRGTRVFVGALLGAMLLAGMLLWSLLGSNIASRMANAETDASVRGRIYSITADAAVNSPWLGTGLGSFEEVFRYLRSDILPVNMSGRVDMAHNTWLEMALVLGLPAMALVLAALGTLVFVWVNGLQTRRRGVVYPALGLAAMVVVVGHGLVDFSLQIEGVLAFSAVLFGTLLAASRPALAEAKSGKARYAVWAGAGVLLAAMAWPVVDQLRVAVALEPAQATLSLLRQQKAVPLADVKATRALLAEYVKDNPVLSRDLAQTDLELAARATNPEIARTMLVSAKLNLEKSLGVAPADPFGWFRLALVRRALGQPYAQAAIQSVLTGPYVRNLTFRRLPMLFEIYATVGPDDRELLANHVQVVWTNTRAVMARGWRQQPQHAPVVAEMLAPLLTGEGDEAVANRKLWRKYLGKDYPGIISR